MLNALYVLHVFATFFLCGLIWVIQWAHYPSFHFVEKARFQEFERFHQKRLTALVAFTMPLEFVTAFSLWALNTETPARIVVTLNLMMVAGLWFLTVVLQMPLHRKLAKEGYDQATVDSLIKSNWIRTALWTLRVPFVIVVGIRLFS